MRRLLAISILKNAMLAAFPDAKVEKLDALITTLALPDPDDSHTLAATICCQATVIVMANLKDFPAQQLVQCDTEDQHPDVLSPSLSN